MSLKTWVLSGMNRVFARPDLPSRDATTHANDVARVEPMLRGAVMRAGQGQVEHLGRYGPLIGAIREELEEFVASHVRLHLAIAERDRYLLTSIGVESTGSEETRELLDRFRREFAPEQVRHFLAKEVVARLPNANAIDLSQFAGIDEARNPDEVDAGAYDELMDELHRGDSATHVRPYKVTLVGRWAEPDPRNVKQPIPRHEPTLTPLAGRELVIDIDDGDGSRRVQLAVVAGRRYVVGKEEGCDIGVKGLYVSRRHCEIWFDHGAWWITDSGSTNGIRVETPREAGSRSSKPGVSIDGDGAVLAVKPGSRIVLSASGEGPPADYPRLTLVAPVSAAATVAADAVRSTPVTPIVPSRAPDALSLTLSMASGERRIDVRCGDKPVQIGRSRNQDVVIDWAHQAVSGHHLDLVECDATGATAVVHGDNGVVVDGVSHRAGTRFRWSIGQPMLLARPLEGEPRCTLTLTRPA